MSGTASHRGSRCPYALLAALLAVWFANSLGVFRCADDALYDLFATYKARAPQQADVLLVYASEQTLGSQDELASLVASVNAFQPSQIAVVHAVTESQRDKLSSEFGAETLFFGVPGQTDSAPVTSSQVSDFSADLDLDNQPILRHHSTRGSLAESMSLPSALALARGADLPDSGRFAIRFRGGADSLPHVGSHVFMNQSIVSDLVTGRVVLIGRSNASLPAVITPSTSGGPRMSQLEVHGHVLQTLIDGQAIEDASVWLGLLVLLVLSTITYNLLRQSTGRRLPQMAIVLLVFAMASLIALAYFGSLRLPLTQSLVAIGFVWLAVWHQRFVTLTELVGDNIVSRQADFHAVKPQSYAGAWSSVANTTKRLFRCHRVAILELPENETHLKIVSTVGCEPTEIEERRRDVLRSPYRDAIEQRCPLRLRDRKFFFQESEARNEFVAPLHVGSQLVGVLVLEIDTKIASDGQFDENLTEFIDEMAEYLLDARHRNQQIRDKNKLTNKLRFTPEEVIANSFQHEEVSQRNYTEMLVNALEASEVMMAVYDGFGRLVRANQKMLDRLSQLNIAASELDLASVACELSSWTITDCQEAFRRCVADRQATEIALLPSESSGVSSLLHIKPLKRSDSGDDSWETNYVSLQIVDGKKFASIAVWQSQLAEDQSERLDAYLTKLNELTAKLSDQEALEFGVLNQVNDLIANCKTALNSNLNDDVDNILCINVHDSLSKVVNSSASNAEPKAVKFKLAGDTDAKAFANPFLLQTGFSNVLDSLVAEIPRKSTVCIETHSRGDRLLIRFRTLSNPDSQQQNDQAASYLTQLYEQRFAELKHWLNAWGGDVSVTCGANYQIEAQVRLQCTAPVLQETAHG